MYQVQQHTPKKGKNGLVLCNTRSALNFVKTEDAPHRPARTPLFSPTPVYIKKRPAQNPFPRSPPSLGPQCRFGGKLLTI